MHFKEGLGWKACYDEERELYTAQRSWRGYYQLCEIDKETYDKLGTAEAPGRLIDNGRHLFESDDDYYTSPYINVYDEKYAEIAPWSDALRRAGIRLPEELNNPGTELRGSEITGEHLGKHQENEK